MCLTLSTVRLLLHEVVAGPEGHEVGVVGGGGDGDGPCAAHVGVAQLVGQLLQLVRAQAVVVPEAAVVARAGGALDALVRAQVEVELGGVRDAHVHGGAGRDVAALAALLLLVRAEEARVVPLLHHDEGDPWFVVWLQLQAIVKTIPSTGTL